MVYFDKQNFKGLIIDYVDVENVLIRGIEKEFKLKRLIELRLKKIKGYEFRCCVIWSLMKK